MGKNNTNLTQTILQNRGGGNTLQLILQGEQHPDPQNAHVRKKKKKMHMWFVPEVKVWLNC